MKNAEKSPRQRPFPTFQTWWETYDGKWKASHPLQAKTVFVAESCKKKHLPNKVECIELLAEKSQLETLPPEIKVWHRISLTGSTKLLSLPPDLQVEVLVLRRCTALTSLPEGLDVCSLDISNCENLVSLPDRATFRGGLFAMANCRSIPRLPEWLKSVTELDISGCPQITELPDDLEITSTIHLGGSGLQKLNERSKNAQIRIDGVLANALIAFHPELIDARMVLAEQNLERRRLMLARMGLEKFMQTANAEVIHQDRDRGGPRSLLKVPMEEDQDIFCLNVICPSTGKRYFIRVPQNISTCHAAAAWIAGFDNPEEYAPVQET